MGVPVRLVWQETAVSIVRCDTADESPGPRAILLPPRIRYLTGLVLALALGARLGYYAIVQSHPGAGHTNFYLVQGQPFGDAMAWHNIARYFSEGTELYFWQGRRLAYPLLLAMTYVWTGAYSPVAVLLNLAVSAASSALVFAALARLFHWTMALPVAVWMIFDPVAATCCCVPLSETFGLFFMAWHFWLLVRALDAERPNSLLLASGLMFGLSNLTRTMTLAALPLDALAIAICLARKGQTWRTAGIAAGWFTAGVMVLMLPSMVSNYFRHGIFSVSDNTTVNLFAGTSPEFLEWSPEVEYLADRAGVHDIGDRYRFYQKKFRENLAQHPGWIARRILNRCQVMLHTLSDIPQWTVALWLAAFLFAQGRDGRPLLSRSSLIPAALAFVAILHPNCMYAFLAIGAVRCALLPGWERNVLLPIMVALTILPLALFGLGGNNIDRLYVLFRWAGVALCLAGLDGTARLLVWSKYADQTAWRGGPLLALSPRLRWGVVAAGVAWSAVTLGILGYRNYLHMRHYDYLPVPRDQLEAFITTAFRRDPSLFCRREQAWFERDSLLSVPVSHWDYLKPNGRLVMWEGELLPELYYFPQGARTDTIWRSFYDRGYDRSVCMLRCLPAYRWITPFIMAGITFPGDLRPLRGENVLMLGRLNDDPTRPIQYSVEGIAVAPIHRPSGRIDLDRLVHADAAPQHQETLRQLRGLPPEEPAAE